MKLIHESKKPSTAKHEVNVARQQVELENKTQRVKGQIDMSPERQFNFRL